VQGRVSRHGAIWGPLAEDIDENSDLRAANVATQTIEINFNGALNPRSAASSAVYTVDVNGKPVIVLAAKIQGAAANLDVILQLASGSLHAGDNVDVFWQNLLDTNNRPLSGHVSLLAE
jgi:hypothetical protein